MDEFSPEDIQRAADEVRRGGFGDFMFSNPGQNRGTSEGPMTSSSSTSQERKTTRKRTSRTSSKRCFTGGTSSRYCKSSGWQNTSHGNNQMKTYWKDGNMWKIQIRKR